MCVKVCMCFSKKECVCVRAAESQARLKSVPRTWIAFAEHELQYTRNENTLDDAAMREIMKNDKKLLNNAVARLLLEEHLDMYIDYIHSQNIEFYIYNESQYSILGLQTGTRRTFIYIDYIYSQNIEFYI